MAGVVQGEGGLVDIQSIPSIFDSDYQGRQMKTKLGWGGRDSARDIFEEGGPLLPQVLLQLVRHPLVLVQLTFHLEGIIIFRILFTKMFLHS